MTYADISRSFSEAFNSIVTTIGRSSGQPVKFVTDTFPSLGGYFPAAGTYTTGFLTGSALINAFHAAASGEYTTATLSAALGVGLNAFHYWRGSRLGPAPGPSR